MRIRDIVFIIGMSIAITLMVWYLFGNSPTTDQLLIGLWITNITLTFKIHGDFQRHLGEHRAQKRKETQF